MKSQYKKVHNLIFVFSVFITGNLQQPFNFLKNYCTVHTSIVFIFLPDRNDWHNGSTAAIKWSYNPNKSAKIRIWKVIMSVKQSHSTFIPTIYFNVQSKTIFLEGKSTDPNFIILFLFNLKMWCRETSKNK